MSSRANITAAALALAGALTVVDQATKLWAVDALVTPGATYPLPGPVDFTLLFNRSTAFGLAPIAGEISRWGLTAVNIAVATGLVIAIVRGTQRLTAIAFAFLIAGALGNAIDRARLGAVIDFFNASKIGFPWVFNGADIWIDVGVGLLALGLMLKPAEEKK